MTDNTEQRRSFRVTETALLNHETIDESDFEKGIERWKIRTTGQPSIRSRALDLDARIAESLYHVRINAPAAADAIELLNNKIELLLEALPEFNAPIEALANKSAQLCELCADGMLFGTDELLEPGTKLFLRFLLLSDNRFFETFCTVTRCIDGDEAGLDKHRYWVAVEFHDMSNAETEILIQHLFSQQSELLRQRRKQTEAES